MDRPGTVLWITGLSGAGKSTVARQCHRLMREVYPNVVLLDGDAVRQVMGEDLGHDVNHRLRNAWRICRLCHLLSEQGIHVVVATMSLFHECQRWNREQMPGYFEVYLEIPLEVAQRRDPKGLYRRFEQGKTSGMVGLDLPFEPPERPDLTVPNENDVDDTVDIARHILRAASSNGLLETLAHEDCDMSH